MAVLKPVFLMAGGRGGSPRSTALIVQSLFRDIGKEKPVVAYVGVASGDNWGFYLMVSGMIKAAGKCRVERIVIAPKKADLEKAREALQSADAIFMSGGDVEEGMEILQQKNLVVFFQDLYRKGSYFFGASAGSIMLAREWVRWRDPDDEGSSEMFPCLDIAPVICDTHAEDDDWVELKAALNLKQIGTTGYGIASGSCLKVYPDGRLEAVGAAVSCYRRGETGIEKLNDLTPSS